MLVINLSVGTTLFAQQSDELSLDRAFAEASAGNPKAGITILDEIIKQQPLLIDAYFLRSNLKLAANDTWGALGDLNKVIQLNPRFGHAYYKRSLIRLLAKDTSGALQDLELAIKNNYPSDEVFALRAQVRAESDPKAAIEDLNEAIKINPGEPKSYANRAALLLKLEERDRALSDLDFLLNWFDTDPTRRVSVTDQVDLTVFKYQPPRMNNAPGDPEMALVMASAFTNRGLIRSFAQNVDAAISDFTKAIRLDSKSIWAHYHRARELINKGELTAALADVNRAIQIDPLNGLFRLEHGAILTMMGNVREANVDFDMLLNTDREVWQKRINERLEELKKKPPQ